MPDGQHRICGLLRALTWAAAGLAGVLLAGCGDLSLLDALKGDSPGELRFSPATALVAEGQTFSFSVLGGFQPYEVAVDATLSLEGDGTWVFPATFIDGTDSQVFTVTATDLLGDQAEAQVTVYDLPALELNVQQVTLVVGMSWVFSASGGKSPYTWAVDDVLQVRDPDPNDSFTFSPAWEGEYWVSVTDDIDVSRTAVVQVVPDPGEGAALAITPTVASVLVGDQLAFTALGGTGPYTFSSSSAPGAFAVPDANPATYLASIIGPDTVTLTDDTGASVTAAVTVIPEGELLTLSPLNPTVSAIGDTVQFTATGGEPPYRFFSKKLAEGSIDPVTGLYRQNSVKNVVVGVEDDFGTIVTTVVKLVVE